MQPNIHRERIKELFPDLPSKEREKMAQRAIKRPWDCVLKTNDTERRSSERTEEIQPPV